VARNALLSAVAALAAVALAGCGAAGEGGAADGSLEVVTTIGMLADAVENIGAERVTVEALMGPGVDPHLYKASEGDVQRLADADLVIFGGLHLEAKLADVLERIGERGAAATAALDRDRLLAPPEFKGQYDPHVWFDVALWADVVRHVRDTLIERDPAGRSTYTRNAKRYLAELADLDTEVRRDLAAIPRDRRVLITAHDAFNYFGRAYDLDVRGLQGISTATEAGTADVRKLAEFIAQRRIPTLFVESSVSPRAIEAVREAVQARGFDVAVGESLFSDAMGDEGTPEGTYVGMVRHNVRAIVEGLGR
jgi:manganese/zinc/iron transport system substrate-binding protein